MKTKLGIIERIKNAPASELPKLEKELYSYRHASRRTVRRAEAILLSRATQNQEAQS